MIVERMAPDQLFDATQACTKIQRIYRGKRARLQYLEMRATTAVVKIQARTRGALVRRAATAGISCNTGAFAASSPSFTVNTSSTRRLTKFRSGSSFHYTVHKDSHPRVLNPQHFMADNSMLHMRTESGTFGTLEFFGDSKRQLLNPTASTIRAARQAQFCRVRVGAETSDRLVWQLPPAEGEHRMHVVRGLVDYMKYTWKVPMPSVIFDVTGSATAVDLRPAFWELFRGSLLHATRSTQAWIVTGGTDAGVMKLVGDSLSTVQSSEVTLGIAPWGALFGRSRLDDNNSAQKDFKKRHMLCTVRVNFTQADHAQLKKTNVDIKEGLQQEFAKYGRIIDIRGFRTAPPDPVHNKYRVEQVSPIPEPEKEHWNHWYYITFHDRVSAANAEEQRRATMSGQTVLLNTVVLDKNGIPQRAARAEGAAQVLSHAKSRAEGAAQALLDVPRTGIDLLVQHRQLRQQRRGQLQQQLRTDEPPPKAQIRAFTMHMDTLAGSRGSSSALPYRYDGQRNHYRESSAKGTKLNPNHSHYILVDDQTVGEFGSDVAVRNDLLEYISYRRDIEMCSTEELRQRAIRGDGVRVAPVLTFVFGGGKYTFHTVMNSMAVGRLVIVVQGSGRLADLIIEWKKLADSMLETRSATTSTNETALSELLEKQNTLARAWLGDPANEYAEHVDVVRAGTQGWQGRKPTDDRLSKEITRLREQLDTVVAYKQLHVFDLEDGTKDLLSLVLASIFDSQAIANSVKLPLAIRYSASNYVQKIMMSQGIKRLAAVEDMSNDARLLVFAAFHDNADMFQTLMNQGGFDVEQVDNLIFLELHQLAQLQVLDNTKDYEPPLSWICARRRERATAPEYADTLTAWKAMSTQEQLTEVKKDWSGLSTKRQYNIVRDDVCRVSWSRLPCLTGWTFRTVHFLGLTRKGYGNAARREYLGSEYTLTQVQRHNSTAMTAVLCGRSGTTLKGNFVTASKAQQLVTDFVGDTEINATLGDDWKTDVFLLGSGTWIAVHDPAVPMQRHDWGTQPNVLLQHITFDTVVGGLDIDEAGRWVPSQHSKQREMSSLLMRNAFAAFRPWINSENVEIGVPWWAMPRSESVGSEMYHSLYQHSLDPLHRLFWAVMTSRDKMAEALWKTLPPQKAYAGAFLASYAITNAKQVNTHTAIETADRWNRKTLRLLDELQTLADSECTRAIFDQNLYFGLEEEMYAETHPELPTKYSALPTDAKLDNAKRRAALQLMGCDPETPRTRVDLALASNCKAFLAHIATQQFIDSLWTSPSFDSYSERLLSGTVLSVLTVPRVKFASALACWILFGGMFTMVYSSLEPPTRMKGLLHPGRDVWSRANAQSNSTCTLCLPWEIIFWIWIFGLQLNELAQLKYDFEYRVKEYLTASGNAFDALLQLTFLAAFILRVVSLMLWQREDELSQYELQRCDDNYPACHLYLCCLGLLSLNIIGVGVRILYNLNVFKDIGILLIIVKDIVTKDVVPFFVVLIIFLFCFEVGGVFFFLASDQSFIMYDGGTYVLTWLDVGNMLDLPSSLGHERWLNSAFQQRFAFASPLHFLYTTAFYVITSIILTNLLIAMMSSTFDSVQAAATQIWRATFSGQVREYCDATIFPLPFNLPEILLNMCTKEKFDAQSQLLHEVLDGSSSVWGRHYVWPLPTSRFDLHFVMNRNKITASQVSPEMLELRAIRSQLKEEADSKRAQEHQQQQLRHPKMDLRKHGIMVRIVDTSAIVVHNMNLARELGVHKIWKPGDDYSDIGHGYAVKVGNLPESLEDEQTLTDLFACYGGVLAASVRIRRGYWDDGTRKRSWAIVSFTSRRAQHDAIHSTAVPSGLKDVDVTRLDELKALTSKTMGPKFQQHRSRAKARSCMGTIASETAGASAIVGERCCAVQLFSDGRVLLVRRAGLEELSFQEVELVWGSQHGVESDPKRKLIHSKLRATTSAIRASSYFQRMIHNQDSDSDDEATESMEVTEATKAIAMQPPEPAPHAQTATGDLPVAKASSDVTDEFTDLLSEPLPRAKGTTSESETGLDPMELDLGQDKLEDQRAPVRRHELGLQWPSQKVSTSLAPAHPVPRHTVRTPGTLHSHVNAPPDRYFRTFHIRAACDLHLALKWRGVHICLATVTPAQANAQVASLVANAMRDHEGDLHVQRAAQRLNALLSTTNASASITNDDPTGC